MTSCSICWDEFDEENPEVVSMPCLHSKTCRRCIRFGITKTYENQKKFKEKLLSAQKRKADAAEMDAIRAELHAAKPVCCQCMDGCGTLDEVPIPIPSFPSMFPPSLRTPPLPVSRSPLLTTHQRTVLQDEPFRLAPERRKKQFGQDGENVQVVDGQICTW